MGRVTPEKRPLTAESWRGLAADWPLGCWRALVRLPGTADARPAARTPGPVRVQPHGHGVCRHRPAHHATAALLRLDPLPQPGRRLGEARVQRVLVLEAAHQPAAGAGDP